MGITQTRGKGASMPNTVIFGTESVFMKKKKKENKNL
jgi:hypothetical protein